MSEFRILSDREHVLKRAGMYIGSTTYEEHQRFLFGKWTKISYVPGLVKIIDEIIDNSVDEAIRTNFEFANVISVDIQNNIVTVTDNGRGIPQHMVTTPEGTQIPQPVAAWTRTKAGSNFDDTNRLTQGMNGVGSSLSNFFSDWFTGVTCDGETEMTVQCTNGAENITWSSKPSKLKGTKVTFCPDFDHFEGYMMDNSVLDIVHDRLQSLSVIFPKITFKFNGKRIVSKFKDYAKLYNDDPFVIEDKNFSLALVPAVEGEGFKSVSFANGLFTKNGGTHVDYVTDDLCEEIVKRIKKEYKVDVTKAAVKSGLTCILIVRELPNLRFDSQTKERLTNPTGDIKRHIDLDFKKLAKVIAKKENIIMPIIAVVLARKEAADKAAATKAAKAAKRAKVAKHVKANLIGTDAETTLFLTEGDSAINYLISVRDQDLHGGFPLRGKTLTTWEQPEAKIVKNAEIFNIMAITGLQFGVDALEVMQYKNIAIMTDADTDGIGSIKPSLISFFARWPELFEDGRIRFIKTPIIIAEPKKGNDVRWYYDLEDFENDRDNIKGYSIRYIKGLASLTESDYHRVINDPVMEIITLPENYKELFDLLYSEDADQRKIWMQS